MTSLTINYNQLLLLNYFSVVFPESNTSVFFDNAVRKRLSNVMNSAKAITFGEGLYTHLTYVPRALP